MKREPARPLSLLVKPGELRAQLAFLRALQRLELVVSVNGQISTGSLDVAQQNAVLSTAIALGPPAPRLDPETIIWRDRALAASGTFEEDSIALADALIVAIKATSWGSKIVYLLPLLGSNLTTARVPLRDLLGVGIAGNTGFTDADYSQSTGLQGDGVGKVLDTFVRPAQLSTGGLGGLGYWEGDMPATGEEPMGCYGNGSFNQKRYVIYINPATPTHRFWWGDVGTNPSAGDIVGPTPNGHYYGQCTTLSDRRLYLDGAQVGPAATAYDLPTLADHNSVRLLGAFEGFAGMVYWGGLCKVAYMTTGTLFPSEIAELHSLLQTYLIAPTGR